ncbi:hypothetical protein [Streptomyces sp. NPDC088261]|uniref:AfsR/SARP family transcriptional regulator n=1 Tax=Streptomyces sp. NPDC088261 TaxID=3365851 RepID=UPI0038229C0B
MPGARRQPILAALLLAPNSVVPLSGLADMTWDDEPPATAVKQVRNSVPAPRERLGNTAQRLIRTEDTGYLTVSGIGISTRSGSPPASRTAVATRRRGGWSRQSG